MLRFLAGVISALLLVGAGVFLFRSSATVERPAPPPPAPAAALQDGASEDEQDIVLPSATPLSREQKRFNRYDKDRNGGIAREEYLASRRKAFAKLDANGDGRLSFEEWAIKTTTKFATADRDRSGSLSAAEFATTAVKRSPRSRPRCPPQGAPEPAE